MASCMKTFPFRRYAWDARFLSVTARAASSNATTFQSLGLRPQMVAAVQAAFPHIQGPTETQAQFIPAILNGNDIILKDIAGSGKSFGLLLSLLNKPRVRFRSARTGALKKYPSMTSIFIVPHRDLAFQLFHWVQSMTLAHKGLTPNIDTIAQVLVRDGGQHLKTGLQTLRKVPPHILIATPQALMDVYNADPAALTLNELSCVVIDEVDYQLPTITTRASKHQRARQKAERERAKLERHPSITRQLLDGIYSNESDTHSPQLVLSSATLGSQLADYVCQESGWLRQPDVSIIRGQGVAKDSPSEIRRGQVNSTAQKILHSVVLVSEGGVRSMPQSAPPVELDFAAEEEEDTEVKEVTIDPRMEAQFAGKASPFNQNMLDAVATAFALDVPAVALLVIPVASMGVSRAVYDLRQRGVDARLLSLDDAAGGRDHLLQNVNSIKARSNPTLLVATPASTRGIDLPDLTHIFLLGIPGGETGGNVNSDHYVHLAGRVGRFGRRGRVITLLEDGGPIQDEDTADEKWPTKDTSRMANIFKRIAVVPVEYDAFD